MFMTIQSNVKDKILATPSETSKVENAPAEMLRDLDQQMEKRADDVKSQDEISLRRGYYDNRDLSRSNVPTHVLILVGSRDMFHSHARYGYICMLACNHLEDVEVRKSG
ncbi:hypothetical protein Tco_0000926 [Tanacetum coccineum]